MKIVLRKSPTGSTIWAMRHFGHRLNWEYEFYGTLFRTKLGIEIPSPFQELNDYLSRPAEGLAARNDRIFAAYSQLQPVINLHESVSDFQQYLQPLVKRLYDRLRVDDMALFLQNAYSHPPGAPQVEQPLRTVVFLLRPMLLVWDHYLWQIHSLVPRDQRELSAWGLLQDSALLNCDAYRQTSVFMQDTLERLNCPPEQRARIQAQTLLRRVAVAPLQPESAEYPTSLAAYVYKYITQKVKSQQLSFA